MILHHIFRFILFLVRQVRSAETKLINSAFIELKVENNQMGQRHVIDIYRSDPGKLF